MAAGSLLIVEGRCDGCGHWWCHHYDGVRWDWIVQRRIGPYIKVGGRWLREPPPRDFYQDIEDQREEQRRQIETQRYEGMNPVERLTARAADLSELNSAWAHPLRRMLDYEGFVRRTLPMRMPPRIY